MRLAIAIMCFGVAGATARAADDIPTRQARSHIQPVGEIAAADGRTLWAGLVTARAPAVLREQLRLERGAGLVVESVAPGSEAERVGLRRHDILVSVDGQLLLVPEQLIELLEASAADAALECRLIRAGAEQTLALRTRPVAAMAARGSLRPAQSTLDLLPRKPPTRVATVTQRADGTLEHRGPDFVVKLTGGAEPRLIVQDARSRIVFNGPIDTPEQRSLVPPAVRAQVEGLERLAAQHRSQEGERGVTTPQPAAARIGTLDIRPVEIR